MTTRSCSPTSRATEAHGDAHAADAAADFCTAVRALLDDHNAHEVKAIGDAVMVHVADAAEGVRLAARIVGDRGGRHRALGIRVGIHTGTAVRRGDDWFGSAVNLASRIADAAGAGEVLLTDATRQRLPEDLQVRRRGPRHFKNVTDPVVATSSSCRAPMTRRRSRSIRSAEWPSSPPERSRR